MNIQIERIFEIKVFSKANSEKSCFGLHEWNELHLVVERENQMLSLAIGLSDFSTF